MQAQRKMGSSDSLGEALMAKKEEEKATSGQLTMNLIVGGLGAGIFSLPWSTAGASIIPALFIMIAVLIVTYYTLMIIVRAGEHHKAFDLGTLLARLPGRMGSVAQFLCNVAVWVSSYFVLVGYFIVIADSAAPFTTGTVFDKRNAVVSFTAVAVLPLCFCNQRTLAWSSSLGVAVSVYIFCCLVYLYWSQDSHPAGICYLGMSRGSIAMFSAMAQTIILQVCILPMYKELEDRSPEKFASVVKVAFSWIFLIFASFSVCAYLVFGPSVHGNVLVDLPNDAKGNMARLAAALSMFAVFPIMLVPITAPIEAYLEGQKEQMGLVTGRSTNEFAMATAKLTIVILVMLAAYFVRDLGFMNVVNGAMSAGIFVALGPALVGLYLLEHQPDLSWKIAMYCLLIFGLLMSALGLIYTDNYVGLMRGGSCLWSK